MRRFPDERISARLWNDRITHIERNRGRATVSVRYNDSYGEFTHHFHTKQVTMQSVQHCHCLNVYIVHMHVDHTINSVLGGVRINGGVDEQPLTRYRYNMVSKNVSITGFAINIIIVYH